jgi:thiamine-phosphate pyrophosphorylase
MASRAKPAEPMRAAARLYLVTPRDAAPPDTLERALAGADVAAVLLRLPSADAQALVDCAREVAASVQDRGAALLLDGHAELTVRAGADGAHLTGVAAFTGAVGALKPQRIAGCGGLATRHDAMVVAEAGADYVMFGEPDATGRRPSFEAVLRRVAWWAEVFEVPCVGFAASLQEVAALASAGADFVAVSDCVFADARGPDAAVADAARRLALVETPA